MTDSDPAFIELSARVEREQLVPATENRLTSMLRQFWSDLDRLHATLDDPDAGLAPLLEKLRTAFLSGLVLLGVVERQSGIESDAAQLAAAVGRCVDLCGRRLGPRYHDLAVRTMAGLPPSAVLGGRASA